jgi:hypothetical protein
LHGEFDTVTFRQAVQARLVIGGRQLAIAGLDCVIEEGKSLSLAAAVQSRNWIHRRAPLRSVQMPRDIR